MAEDALNERVITPMSPKLISAIDDFRFQQRMPSRAEAIRQLISIGLAAADLAAKAPPDRPTKKRAKG